MKKFILLELLALYLAPWLALAAPACTGYKAYQLQGKIVEKPHLQLGRIYKNVQLSHTVFYIVTTDNSKKYQVSVDNIYAKDYDQNKGKAIPKSFLDSFQINNQIELCGESYVKTPGIHWVHSNCGNPNKGPAGYAIVNGVNLTTNNEYCYLWKKTAKLPQTRHLAPKL